jgi:hypothetical protein
MEWPFDTGDAADLAIASNVDRGTEAIAGAVAGENEDVLVHLAPAKIGGSCMTHVVIHAVNRHFPAAHHR